MKYIDVEKLKAEIEKLKKDNGKDGRPSNVTERLCSYLLSIIDSLQQEQQPEHGYLRTEYVPGKKPIWKVGDTLAYYLCTSNEEGEIVVGKVTNVEFDVEYGWIYTFGDKSTSDEQSLIEEGVYKKCSTINF